MSDKKFNREANGEIPEDYVERAEAIIKKIKNDKKKITHTQLRNIFDPLMGIYSEASLSLGELSPDVKSELNLLRIRIVYNAGRDDTVRWFVRDAKLLEYIKAIGSDKDKLMKFTHYMEALVAYHKFHIKEKGRN